MTTWTVLKLTEIEDPQDGVVNHWIEVGEVESRYTYGGPEAQHVGERFGVGEFIFIEVDGKNAERLTVVQTSPTFMEAPEPAQAFA